MSQYSSKRFINFIRSNQNYCCNVRENDGTETESEQQLQQTKDDNEFGEKISKEYKELTIDCPKTSSTSDLADCTKRIDKSNEIKRRTTTTTTNYEIKVEDIFKFCQYGQIESCQKWLSKFGSDDQNRPIDIRDRFGWTPLMVASGTGNVSLVRFWLDSASPDCTLRCNKGYTAQDIAKRFGHYSIVDAINEHIVALTYQPNCSRTNNIDQSGQSSKSKSKRHRKSNEPKKLSSFECQFCGPITGVDPISHRSSISHQLKSSSTESERVPTVPIGNYSHLDRTSYKGYQLLVKEGWNEKSGLGPKENGRRYPLIPAVKPDRSCLGRKRSKHKSHSKSTKSESERKEKKLKKLHQQESRCTRSRQLEIDFRRQFY